MTVSGAPISEYRFRPAAATIVYTSIYEEEQARIFAEIGIAEYEALPGTPMWINPEIGGLSKSHIVVLYRNANLIPAVAQDAQARQMERDAKRHR